MEILTLGGIEHASITLLQRRKTPKRLPKNGKQNNEVEPWNACAHNMKLINHDLKDKWILDIGATNHMSGHPEVLDGTTCLVPSSSVNLGIRFLPFQVILECLPDIFVQ